MLIDVRQKSPAPVAEDAVSIWTVCELYDDSLSTVGTISVKLYGAAVLVVAKKE